MTELTKELLEITAKEFPTIPKHMIKLIYDFDRINPTYLQDNPEIFNKPFKPEIFSEKLAGSVGILNPEDLPETILAEGLDAQPIKGISEEDYQKELDLMKKEELKKDLEEENKKNC